MLSRTVRMSCLLTAVMFLVANRADSADLLVRFAMEETASPLVDSVSGLETVERADGHVYSQPGPDGFGNAAGVTDLGAWVLTVDDSAELRNLVNDFTVAAWAYVDSDIGFDKPEGGSGVNRIMGDADNWDADGWAWGIQNDGRILFTKNGIIDAWTLDGHVELDEWTHVAVTVSVDDGITYYVNGIEVDNLGDTADLNQSPGNNGQDDFWGIAQANNPDNEQWFAGLLDEVRVYSDLLTPEEIEGLLVPDTNNALKAGDADMDYDFDQLDLVQVQIAAKYLTGQPATWGDGDWNGAPGGAPGSPPAGDSLFNQSDIIAALAAGIYLTGPYAAVSPGGQNGDGLTSIVYDAGSGELSVDAPAGTELTSINIDSAASIFTGDAAQNLGGSFDNDADDNIFKATFGDSFGSVTFGNVAQAGLSEQFVADDLTVVGSLSGGGGLGDVDLVYVPEPATAILLAVGLLIALGLVRRADR